MLWMSSYCRRARNHLHDLSDSARHASRAAARRGKKRQHIAFLSLCRRPCTDMPLETNTLVSRAGYYNECRLAVLTRSAPRPAAALDWLHAPFHTQTKLGLGHLNEFPVKATWPVEQLKLKTAQSSESWLATMSHWPLLSNWKWQVSKYVVSTGNEVEGTTSSTLRSPAMLSPVSYLLTY